MAFAFLRSLSLQNLKATFLRFPVSVLCGAVASTLAVYSTYDYDADLLKPGLTAFLGILLCTGLALFAERHRMRSWIVQLLGIPVLAALIYSVKDGQDITLSVRFGLLFLSSLALIFAGPYLWNKEEKSFWEFGVKTWNRAFFAIATALISLVALELALLSISELFGVDVDERWYRYVYDIFLVFVPNIVFLSGVAKDFKKLDADMEKHAFRSLGLFLFAPLLSLYFVILVAYVVKILVTQVWPNGFVAMPILLFTMIGFVMTVLAYPVLQDKNSGVLRFFSRFFLRSLPVFMVVYFSAFWIRIQEYGVTEWRYLGVLLGMVILGWALYFGWAKNARLKFIPLALFVVPFLASFGPWGAFSVSQSSQGGRLVSLLEENGLIGEDGMVVKSSDEAVSLEARREISGALDYLTGRNAEDVLVPLFGEDLARDSYSSDFLTSMGLSYVNSYSWDLDRGVPYYFSPFDTDPMLIAGYDYAVHYYAYEMAPGQQDNVISYNLATDQILELKYVEETSVLSVSVGKDMLNVPLQTVLESWEGKMEEGSYPREQLVAVGENKDLAVKVYFNSLSYRLLDEERLDLSLDANVLVRVK